MNTLHRQDVAFMAHLCASNDINGNPRRCYVAYGHDGTVIGVWDEGYKGSHCVPAELRAMASNAPRIEVGAGFYRDHIRIGQEGQ